METVLQYRGRQITDSDVIFIRELIGSNPESSRRALSKTLCEAWGWVQQNGHLRDMVCRGLMLELHRAGHIELPPVRRRPPNPLARRHRPPLPIDLDQTPMRGRLADLGPLTFGEIRRQVRRSSDEPLFNGLLEAH